MTFPVTFPVLKRIDNLVTLMIPCLLALRLDCGYTSHPYFPIVYREGDDVKRDDPVVIIILYFSLNRVAGLITAAGVVKQKRQGHGGTRRRQCVTARTNGPLNLSNNLFA